MACLSHPGWVLGLLLPGICPPKPLTTLSSPLPQSLLYKKVNEAQYRSHLANEMMMYHMKVRGVSRLPGGVAEAASSGVEHRSKGLPTTLQQPMGFHQPPASRPNSS